jgi:hypothetical protein
VVTTEPYIRFTDEFYHGTTGIDGATIYIFLDYKARAQTPYCKRLNVHVCPRIIFGFLRLPNIRLTLPAPCHHSPSASGGVSTNASGGKEGDVEYRDSIARITSGIRPKSYTDSEPEKPGKACSRRSFHGRNSFAMKSTSRDNESRSLLLKRSNREF